MFKKILIYLVIIIIVSIIATVFSYEKPVNVIKKEIKINDTIRFDYNKIPSPYKKQI